jgi:hypothetical protein
MSSGIIDQITLECLMNKETYNKLMSHKSIVIEKNKDKKFYRKRINNLTKELLLSNPPDNLMPDVSFAFDNYIKTCIHFFKIIDETDIIQQDYNGPNCKKKAEFDEPKEEDHKEEDCSNDSDASDKDTNDTNDTNENKDNIDLEDIILDTNTTLTTQTPSKNNPFKIIDHTLDSFMSLHKSNSSEHHLKKTKSKKKKEEIMPKQKEIDLTNPDLKNKGICKKKNINNKYDEA